MISPGALSLKLHQKFGHGLRAAWYRDMVRPRILQTPPVRDTEDSTCEIHVLTSATDWLNLMWALKSFYWNSGRQYALCIHGDNTLGESHIETLATHFPQARIISTADADAAVLAELSAFPRCLDFRRTNHLSPKIFDFRHFLKSDRMLLLDSDVLFFREPAELLRRIEDRGYTKNTVNGDIATCYTVTPETVLEHSGVNLIERFNSGLGLIHQGSIRLDWLEEFLGLPGILGHFWRIEQTLYALCSSKFGVELLPSEYDVKLRGALNGEACRHYVGAIRHRFYNEGMRNLAGLLREQTVPSR